MSRSERYVVVPAHTVSSTVRRYEDPALAAGDAARLVEKDRIPRVVLQVLAEVRVAATPQVDIVPIAEGRHG